MPAAAGDTHHLLKPSPAPPSDSDQEGVADDGREEAIIAEAGRRLPIEQARRRQPLDDLPALISVPKAAAILGLTRATAYRYAAAGELPTRRFGGRRVYVVTAKLRALIETGGEAA